MDIVREVDMLNITFGKTAVIIRGDLSLAVAMLENMYENYLLTMHKCESVDAVFAHQGHAWILQEHNGWVVMESMPPDQAFIIDLFQKSGRYLDDTAYSVLLREEDNSLRHAIRPINSMGLGIYDPKDDEYQFMTKTWFLDDWDIYKTPDTGKIPVSLAKLSRATIEDFLAKLGIPVQFGGREKRNPLMYVLKLVEKTDEEWAEYYQGRYVNRSDD